MRADAAALPEPCSATTSTGTSFCDSSRITASTVRMPALTLSSQTRAPPFCGVPAVARIFVLSRSMLFPHYSASIFRGQDSGGRRLGQGLIQSRAHSLPIRSKIVASCQKTIFGYLSMACDLVSIKATALIGYHIADKWEIYCPQSLVICGDYFPLILGIKS